MLRADATRRARPARCARSTLKGADDRRGAVRLRRADRASTANFDLPIELRNDVARVEIAGERSAGAVCAARRALEAPPRRASPRARAPTSRSRCSRRPIISSARSRPSPMSRECARPASTDPIVALLDEKPSVLVLADMSVGAGPGARRARRSSSRTAACCCASPAPVSPAADDDLDADCACAAAGARSAARCPGRRRSTSRRSSAAARSSASQRPTK